MAKDYYKVLGVEKNATEDDIKKAYRRLAHQYHPDKKGGDAEHFKSINEAYQILSNKEKRRQYDQFGRVFEGGGGPQGNPFGAGFGGFGVEFDPSMFDTMGDAGEIFDMFFEGLGMRRKRRTYERGADLEIALTISLEEAFHGTAKIVPITHFIACAECKGQGHNPGAGVTPCAACMGQGEVRETRRGFFGNAINIKSCAACAGAGNIPNKICTVCAGSGRIKTKETITVNIMQGIENNQIIKVGKAGDRGPRGAEAGDLYIHMRIAAHPIFERRGNDLIIKKEVSLLDLLINKKIEALGIGGECYSLDLPHDVAASEAVRIPNGGMPRLGSRARGDLFVQLIIKRPKKLSVRAKQLLEDLKKETE